MGGGGWWVVVCPFLSYEIEIGDEPGPKLDNFKNEMNLGVQSHFLNLYNRNKRFL